MTTETPSSSSDIRLRAKRLMDRFPTELSKAIHVQDKLGFVLLPGDLPKLPKPFEDGNPLLRARITPLHIGAVKRTKPKASHKAAAAAAAGVDPEDLVLEFVIEVKAAVWNLLSESGKNGELFDKLLSIEVVEKKDGSLAYKTFTAGAGYHEESTSRFGSWTDDIVDPRQVPKLPPPTPEELSKEQAKANLANRPDALVVTSSPED